MTDQNTPATRRRALLAAIAAEKTGKGSGANTTPTAPAKPAGPDRDAMWAKAIRDARTGPRVRVEGD